MYATDPGENPKRLWRSGWAGFSLSIGGGALSFAGAGVVDIVAAAVWVAGIIIQIAASRVNARIPAGPA